MTSVYLNEVSLSIYYIIMTENVDFDHRVYRNVGQIYIFDSNRFNYRWPRNINLQLQ